MTQGANSYATAIDLLRMLREITLKEGYPTFGVGARVDDFLMAAESPSAGPLGGEWIAIADREPELAQWIVVWDNEWRDAFCRKFEPMMWTNRKRYTHWMAITPPIATPNGG